MHISIYMRIARVRTDGLLPPVHVEQPPHRREAVAAPARRRRNAARRRGEVFPAAAVGGVVGVEIVQFACRFE